MLFQLTTENHIRVVDEPEPANEGSGDTTFASEQELRELAGEWPMKRLVEIWSHLPRVEPVTRFTDRTTAVRRIWRAVQPKGKEGGKIAPRVSSSRQRPAFREGSKAAQVCSLLSRPEGATLNEIRTATGWQAHTVRGFISRNLGKQGRRVRSFEKNGERVYRASRRKSSATAGTEETGLRLPVQQAGDGA
jgi:Protein of unknown function (DUF3489)